MLPDEALGQDEYPFMSNGVVACERGVFSLYIIKQVNMGTSLMSWMTRSA
jgi:hypothetical protein